jgi:segregation and condensation protein B
VLGRKEIPGRPLIYATTKRFLEVFGLKNLKDLPTPKEIEEFGSTLSEEMPEAAEDIEPETEDSEDQEQTQLPLQRAEDATAAPEKPPESES